MLKQRLGRWFSIQPALRQHISAASLSLNDCPSHCCWLCCRGSACVLLQDCFWSAPCSTPAAAHVPTSQTSLPCSPSTWKRVMTAQIRSLGSSVSMSQVTLLILTRTASTFSYRDKNYNREGNVQMKKVANRDQFNSIFVVRLRLCSREMGPVVATNRKQEAERRGLWPLMQ